MSSRQVPPVEGLFPQPREKRMRLDKNLARKLKDRSFPKKDFEVTNEAITNPPSLEELIEAVGCPFDLFSGRADGQVLWLSYQDKNRGLGQTPIEAVAHLWLTLNKKTG